MRQKGYEWETATKERVERCEISRRGPDRFSVGLFSVKSFWLEKLRKKNQKNKIPESIYYRRGHTSRLKRDCLIFWSSCHVVPTNLEQDAFCPVLILLTQYYYCYQSVKTKNPEKNHITIIKFEREKSKQVFRHIGLLILIKK